MEGIWNRRHNPLEFEQALVTVAKILSANPCVLTGLDKKGYGCIDDGAKADVCVLDIAGSSGDFRVVVELTIVDGKIIYRAT